jgi:EAL and modified HD-GYP domain-containing signal transduction protein
MLGEREIRRWVRLVATMAAGRHHSNELVISALVRARFCELLGISLRLREVDLFFLGLLSLMDTILDTPLNTILQKVRVDHEIEIVLLGGNNRLRPVYRLMLAQESGEWKEVAALARNLHLDEKIVANLHWQAMEWARTVSSLG